MVLSKHYPIRCFWLLCSLVVFAACNPTPPPVGLPTAPAPTALVAVQTSTPTSAPPVPTPTMPLPTPCGESSGKTVSLAVVSSAMSGALQARVHLPPCYDPTGKHRYPVLYLLHGQGSTSDQWERLGFFTAADSHTLSGGQPFIIVLPGEENTSDNPFESPFGTALTTAMVPQMDADYPTCTLRNCRAIGGLSRGASWAVYLGLKNWGQFSIIGAHSFPPFYSLDLELPGLLRSIAPGQAPRMYLDIGCDDPYRAPAAAFEVLLNQGSIPHEWYLNAGSHDEAYWSKHIDSYVEWYSAQFTFANQP